MNNAKKIQNNKPKRYLNKNLKTLVRLVEGYSENGKIEFVRLQELAEEEDIIERKFFTHFYQACNLGFIKKQNDIVFFIKDFDP